MSKYFLIAISVVAVFLITNFFVSLFLVKNRLDTQIIGQKFVDLGRPLSFEFVPKHDSINILIFTFKNPGLINKSTYDLKIYDNKELLRAINFSGYNIGDPSDLKLQFDPIANAKDRNLKIEIAGEDFENPLKINVDDKGNPSLRAYYRTRNKQEIFKDLITQRREKFFSNLAFFAVWSLLLVGVLIYGTRHEKK